MDYLSSIGPTLKKGDVIFLFNSPMEDRKEYKTFVVKDIRTVGKGKKGRLVLENPKRKTYEINLDNLPNQRALILESSSLVENHPRWGWRFKH